MLSALTLSAVAGYYSIIGMTAIFAASWWPIVIMTGSLEFSKLVVASWLYRNWSKTPTFLKAYFSSAVIVLMVITSLGIFGFLSKAHIDQTAGVDNNPLLIEQLNQQITVEQSRIDDNRKIITQMDDAVNSMLKQSTNDSAQKANKGTGIAKQATALRNSQKKDRTDLTKIIDESNTKIQDLNKQKLKLEQEQIKIEAEVGPIKYIAQMMYGDKTDKNLLERAVRYVIILIIMVFDPLAVLMIIAANMSFMQYKDESEDSDQVKKKDSKPVESIEPEVGQPVSFVDVAIPPADSDPLDNGEEFDTPEEIQEKIEEIEDQLGIPEETSEPLSDILVPEPVREPVSEPASEPVIEPIAPRFLGLTSLGNTIEYKNILDLITVDESVTSKPEELDPLTLEKVNNDLFDIKLEDLILEQEEVVEQKLPEVDNSLSIIADPVSAIETTTIDGMTIDDWLAGKTIETTDENPITEPENNTILNQTKANPVTQMQTNTNQIISRKPDDILNTIKRYHNVRLDDARRTLR